MGGVSCARLGFLKHMERVVRVSWLGGAHEGRGLRKLPIHPDEEYERLMGSFTRILRSVMERAKPPQGEGSRRMGAALG